MTSIYYQQLGVRIFFGFCSNWYSLQSTCLVTLQNVGYVGKYYHTLNRMAAGINKFPVAAPFVKGCDCHVFEYPHRHVVLIVSMLPLQCFVLLVIMFPHS